MSGIGVIEDALAHTGRAGGPDRARRLAWALGGSDDLEEAIARAAQEDFPDLRADLLAYREALRERADPGRLSARLAREACGLELRADLQDQAAAERYGKAAYRQGRGDTALATELLHSARAAEVVASDLRRQAFERRLRLAQITALQSQTEAIGRVALPA